MPKRIPNKKYTAEFKIKVVETMLDAFCCDSVHKARVEAELPQIAEEVDRAAEKPRACNDLITGLQNVEQCHGDGRHAGGTGNCADAALERRDALFKGIDGRVPDAGIGKTRRLIMKHTLQLFGRILRKGADLIDRRQSCTGRRFTGCCLVEQCGIMVLVDICVNSESDSVTVANIAGRQNLSAKYLEQIVPLLKHAHIIRSVKGARGGYYLARPASEITMLQVIDALDSTVLSGAEF